MTWDVEALARDGRSIVVIAIVLIAVDYRYDFYDIERKIAFDLPPYILPFQEHHLAEALRHSMLVQLSASVVGRRKSRDKNRISERCKVLFWRLPRCTIKIRLKLL